MIRKTHLVGRAGKDIEMVSIPSGKSLAKFTLAVETGYDEVKKERLTEWYDVACWDALAEALFDAGGHPMILKGERIWAAGKTSVFIGKSGDRKQIDAREVGLVERFPVGIGKSSKGVIIDEEREEKEEPLEGVTEGEW